MRSSPNPAPDLAVHPCRSLCSWHPTPARLDDLPVLACRGCGSQWVRTEPWTPIDHTGRIPDAVRAEVAQRPIPAKTPSGTGATLLGVDAEG